jgi:hypothetical protein
MEEDIMHISFRFCVVSLGMLAFWVTNSPAQGNADRIKTIQANLNSAKAAYDQLPDDVKQVTPRDHRLEAMTRAVNRMAPGLIKGTGASWQPSDGWDQGGADENGLVQLNNPARDMRFSPFAGFTQNQAATARCGNSVVVAFNDSGSLLETLITGTGGVSQVSPTATGTGGLSMSGVASSHNGGESFSDRGAVPPGPDVNTFLMGKPSVACSDPNNFYLVQEGRIFSPGPAGGYLNPRQAIMLSRSSDGGATWSDPVPVATQPLPTDPSTIFAGVSELFEDPSIVVDPTNHQRVYVSYTHMSLGRDCAPNRGPTHLSTVELIVSIDGGKTFNSGSPLRVDLQCSDFNGVLDVGTRMAISSNGTVSVAWENDVPIDFNNLFDGLFVTMNRVMIPVLIEVASITPGGKEIGPVGVEGVTAGGALVSEPFFAVGIGPISHPTLFLSTAEVALQGGFENTRGFDLAVDRSGGPTDGNVYVVWNDSVNGFLSAPELEDQLFQEYSFTDVFFSVSTDGGQTFSPSKQLNSDLQPTKTRGHDHFRPVVAVDKKGKVAACWYDRRNDPQNFQFERFCAESVNAGANWVEFNIPGSLSTPSRGQDLIVYQLLGSEMGRNDNLTTDFNGHEPGFLGGIQWMSSGMNPDVKLVKFH